MHDRTPFRRLVDKHENNSGTILGTREKAKEFPEAVTPAAPAAPHPPAVASGCVYVEGDTWPAGAPAYCNAPTAPRAPYCAKHLALCRIDPKSRAGRRLIREQRLLAREIEPGTPPPEPLDNAFDPAECDLAPTPVIAREEK